MCRNNFHYTQSNCAQFLNAESVSLDTVTATSSVTKINAPE